MQITTTQDALRLCRSIAYAHTGSKLDKLVTLDYPSAANQPDEQLTIELLLLPGERIADLGYALESTIRTDKAGVRVFITAKIDGNRHDNTPRDHDDISIRIIDHRKPLTQRSDYEWTNSTDHGATYYTVTADDVLSELAKLADLANEVQR